MQDGIFAAYLERHRWGELTERHVEHLVAELRRLREELKLSQHELLQVRRRASVLVRARLDRATA